MIVERDNFERVIAALKETKVKSLDTETTGLRPYHGDELFSVIIATKKNEFYFNFNEYPDIPPQYVLPDEWIKNIGECCASDEDLWYFCNAKFDMAMLENAGVEVKGFLWDVKVVERVLENDLVPGSYDLESIGERYGHEKDAAVDEYIVKNRLWEYRYGAVSRYKHPFYNRVPWKIITKYGCRDGRITFDIGEAQDRAVKEIDTSLRAGWPPIRPVVLNECRLLRNVYAMERRGVMVDVTYCRDAIGHNHRKLERCQEEFEKCTGRKYKKSNKLFQEIFADELDKWGKTKPTKTKPHGGVSFDKDTVLPHLEHPAAKLIIDISSAQANINYFKGFIYHADKGGVIHTHLNQDGADTGRFSSSNPNLQNLKRVSKDVDKPSELPVRRALIPRPGKTFVMMDYDQFQYRLMLEYANAKALIRRILKDGVDVHQATADVAKIERYQAKTTNFSILFGAGLELLAANLGKTTAEAAAIRDSVFRAAPEIHKFTTMAEATARTRKWVFNWYGRRYKFPNVRACFTAPNKIIQGGEADVIKIGINRVCDYISGSSSDWVLTVHDEVIGEFDKADFHLLPGCKEILESVYPSKNLPMTVGVSHSHRSLADKEEGYPNGSDT